MGREALAGLFALRTAETSQHVCLQDDNCIRSRSAGLPNLNSRLQRISRLQENHRSEAWTLPSPGPDSHTIGLMHIVKQDLKAGCVYPCLRIDTPNEELCHPPSPENLLPCVSQQPLAHTNVPRFLVLTRTVLGRGCSSGAHALPRGPASRAKFGRISGRQAHALTTFATGKCAPNIILRGREASPDRLVGSRNVGWEVRHQGSGGQGTSGSGQPVGARRRNQLIK